MGTAGVLPDMAHWAACLALTLAECHLGRTQALWSSLRGGKGWSSELTPVAELGLNGTTWK